MEQKIYHSKWNVVYACYYLIVWCPKYRRKMLVGDVAVRLETIIREVCEEREARVSALEIMPDHVQLLVQIDLQFGVHRLVQLSKVLITVPAPGVPEAQEPPSDLVDK